MRVSATFLQSMLAWSECSSAAMKKGRMTIMEEGRGHKLQLLMVAQLLLAASVSALAMRSTKVEDIGLDGEGKPRVAAVWAFGDSLADAGSNTFFNSLLQADFKPYGQQFGKPTGRFTNGRNYVDFVAEYVGLPALEPYLKKSKRKTLLGANYASAGGGILRTTNAADVVISFPDQILQFNETKVQISQTLRSASAAQDLFSRSLFFISIGTNDLLVSISNMSIPQEEYLDGLVVILKDRIEALYDAGARKLMVLGVGPLGCLPLVIVAAGIKDGKCIETVNVMVKSFNAKLEALVLGLNSSFPELRAIIGKPFVQFRNFITKGDYGFKAGTTACCGAGAYNGVTQCGRPANLITNAPFNLCENVDEYVFWDYGHPTDRAYGILSEQFWAGNSSAVVPVNLKTLVSS